MVRPLETWHEDAAQDAAPLLDQVTRGDGRVAFFTGFDGGADTSDFIVRAYPPGGGDSVSRPKPAQCAFRECENELIA